MKDKHSRYDHQPVEDEAMVSKHHNNNHTRHPKDGARNNSKSKQHQSPKQQQQQQQYEQEDPATAKNEHRQQHEGEDTTNNNNSTTTSNNKKFEVGIVEIASNLSDLSGSTGDAESSAASDTLKQFSTSARNADAKDFEVLIQAKHAEACKAMGVSSYGVAIRTVTPTLSIIFLDF